MTFKSQEDCDRKLKTFQSRESIYYICCARAWPSKEPEVQMTRGKRVRASCMKLDCFTFFESLFLLFAITTQCMITNAVAHTVTLTSNQEQLQVRPAWIAFKKQETSIFITLSLLTESREKPSSSVLNQNLLPERHRLSYNGSIFTWEHPDIS